MADDYTQCSDDRLFQMFYIWNLFELFKDRAADVRAELESRGYVYDGK